MESKRILLVEDNPDDVMLTLNAFKETDIEHEIVVAHSGEEALDFLFGGERIKPTLIIMDLKLPKTSGLDVIKRVRGDERTRLTPIVVLTTSDEERDTIQSYRSGVNSYICKPTDFQRFADFVSQICFYWLVLNEPPPIS